MSQHIEQGITTSIMAAVLAVLTAGVLGIPSPWSWVAIFVLYFVFVIALGVMRNAYQSWRYEEEPEDVEPTDASADHPKPEDPDRPGDGPQ